MPFAFPIWITPFLILNLVDNRMQRFDEIFETIFSMQMILTMITMANPMTKTTTMMVMASLTLKMRTIPTLTTKTTNCKVFPFPPEIIFQFEMIHLPNCSQSTTILPFRNLLKYCSDKKIKTKMSPFSLFPSIFWINMKENNDWKVIQCMTKGLYHKTRQLVNLNC